MTDPLIPYQTDSELQESVPVKITDWNGQAMPVANLRDLHNWLKVRTKFATWIKRRIEEYEFVEDIDFRVSRNRKAQESKTYKQEKIEYFGTLNMCKELAMVERTKRGKEARRYFRHGSIQGNNGEWSPKLELWQRPPKLKLWTPAPRGPQSSSFGLQPRVAPKAQALDSSPACNPISPFFEPCLILLSASVSLKSN